VWRGNDSELLCSLKGHTDWVSDIVINDDNNILCSASHDGSILVWRVGRVVRKELVFSEAANVFLDLRK
jgi:WD40 repeat protein